MGIDKAPIVNKWQKKQHSLFDLFSLNSGIVNYITEIENERNHPDVFVVAATSCNLEKYGIPIKYKVNGSGAGLTWENAHLSALGETLERYCLSIIHKENLTFASSDMLKEKGIAHTAPESFSLFSEDQDPSPFTRFTGDTMVTWTPVRSLVHRNELLAPACVVYLPYYFHHRDEGERLINASISTGAACAVSFNEALLKGISELVERDSFMIMWKNRISCPKVIIDEASGIYDIYKKKFCRAGLSFDIYYTRFDFQMPSFFGVLSDSRGNIISRVVGGAAHSDPEVGVLKTLIELVQGLVWKDYKGVKEFPIVENFTNVNSFEDRMELYAYNDMSEALSFLPKEGSIKLSEIPVAYGYGKGDVDTALEQVVREFGEKGYDILAADMTSPEAEECGVYIAKVVIPALEVMDGEYKFQLLGGKRWREVPYKLHLKAEDEEIVLNPFPHPYP